MDYPYLDKLTDPRTLASQSLADLAGLAQDIRHRITEIVSVNGGHLGPNLGSVESIIALHTVFDFSYDRLIFDVGHQAYPHKLLTGRHRDFPTLRRKSGVSGYPHPAESPYDTFRTGHASTSISTGLGLAEGSQRQHPDRPPCCVVYIGDGAMGGGMAYEGLNHAGHLRKNLLVVLNDNRMSISPTVGAMAAYLNRLRHQHRYRDLRDDALKLMKKLPRVGARLEETANIILDTMKHSVNPGQIFTELGFDYQGPLDGHDLKAMISLLKNLQTRPGPVLLHILTEKGRGYQPGGRAGLESIGPHALSPKSSESTAPVVPVENRPGYSEIFGQAMIRLAEKHAGLVGLTAAMPEGTGLVKFSEQYPDRYYDVGICEQHATGFCAGLAAAGLRPVFAVYSTFLQRAFDQVFHDVVLQNLPVMFGIDRAGLVGDDGPSHQGLYDIAYLRPLPGLVIMAPKDGVELAQMLDFGLSLPRPSTVRYPREAAPPDDFFFKHETLELGKPEVLTSGGEVCLLALGAMVGRAWTASSLLVKDGINNAVVNARFVKPLNPEFLAGLTAGYRLVVTLEDGALAGGFGSAVCEAVMQAGGDFGKIRCLGVPDRLIEHATREEQLQECGLDPQSIVAAVKKFVQGSGKGL
jgi:1-deoxy-D-xylulose-5-phosphate synthase